MFGALARLALLLLLPPVDAHGDPLPPGARARLGTVRWRHGGPVLAMGFTADGQGLASVSQDGTVRLFDVPSGRVRWMRYDPDRPIRQLAVSPVAPLLVVARADDHLQVWAVEGGRLLHRGDHLRGTRALVFSPDGQHLASAGLDGLHVWETTTWTEVFTQKTSRHRYWAVAFQPRGPLLATWGHRLQAGESDEIRLWNYAAGQLVCSLPFEPEEAPTLVFAHDGRTLLTAREGKLLRWNVASGKELPWLPLNGLAGEALALAPDGRILAGGGATSLGFWDARTGEALGPPLPRDAQSLAFSHDGQLLAVAGTAAHYLELVAVANRHLIPTPAEPTGPLRALAFAPDGDLVVGVGLAPVPYLWDARVNLPVARPWKYRQPSPGDPRFGWRGAAFMAGDGRLLTWGIGSAQVWDLTDGEVVSLPRRLHPQAEWPRPLRTLTPSARGPWVVALAAAPSRNRRRSPHRTSPADRWQRPTVAHVLEWPPLRPGWAVALPPGLPAAALTADGSLLAVGKTTIDLWERGQDRPRFHLAGHRQTVNPLAFSPDQQWLASGGDDGSVRLWNLVAGREQALLYQSERRTVASVAFSPDGCMIAAAVGDTMLVWETATAQVRATYRGHVGPVNHLAFSPDGRTLASAGEDTTVLLWDLYRRPPPAADAADPWEALAHPGAGAAFRAVRGLVAAGDAAVPFLAQRLRPVPAVTPVELRQLVADLGSPTAVRRAAAMAVLDRLGPGAAAAVRQAAVAGLPEQRRRAEALLAALDGGSPPAVVLRDLRAVEVLERVGTAAATAELTRLTTGADGAPLTAAARAALARLGYPDRR